MSAALEELLQIMRTLRDPQRGCAWDRVQTFASIAPSTLEEAFEVVDAIEREDLNQLKDELGDLLFQVVFHAQMASEQGRFDFEAVAAGMRDKLVRRHPHVFAGAAAPDARTQSQQWEALKAQERAAAAGDTPLSELDGVALALPALTRAVKLSKRAARVGFDWDRPQQTAAKVAEELDEVLAAIEEHAGGGPSAHIVEEIGDLLFAAANLARKVDVDAEGALRAANAKFERRFRFIEAAVRAAHADIRQLPLAALEALWEQAKRQERGATGLNDA